MGDDEIRNPVRKETTTYPQDGVTISHHLNIYEPTDTTTWTTDPNQPYLNFYSEPDTLKDILATLKSIERLLIERLPVRVVRELE